MKFILKNNSFTFNPKAKTCTNYIKERDIVSTL